MRLRSIHYFKAVTAGTVGTVAMSLSCMISIPALHVPATNSIGLLTKLFWNSADLGWMIHLSIGIVLAIIYALFQITILPLLDIPCFTGSVEGAILGGIYGESRREK